MAIFRLIPNDILNHIVKLTRSFGGRPMYFLALAEVIDIFFLIMITIQSLFFFDREKRSNIGIIDFTMQMDRLGRFIVYNFPMILALFLFFGVNLLLVDFFETLPYIGFFALSYYLIYVYNIALIVAVYNSIVQQQRSLY